MATYSGFFNSVGGDRRYDATDFSRFFDGLIKDGVYVNFPETNDDSAKGLHVSANTEITGLNVKVAPGRCWFNGLWMYNDAFLNIALDPTTNTLVSRIDAIVVDVNGADSSREVNIIVVKGDQASTPDKPSMIHTATRNQYPLAYVTVAGGATSLSNQNIEDCIQTGETPAVEAIVEYSSKTKAEIDTRINNILTPTFEEAATAENINSGDNINVMWGKIKRIFNNILFNVGVPNAGKVFKVGNDGKANWFNDWGVTSKLGAGLCPALPDENRTDKYLCQNGSWSAPAGTNTNALTVNGVKVYYNQTAGKYGYDDAGGNFKSFRQPTGDAVAANVLSGKTFANASSDSINGGMSDFSNNKQTVTPTATGLPSTANETLALPAGYHNGVIVNRTAPYNKGKTDAEAVTWIEDIGIGLAYSWNTMIMSEIDLSNYPIGGTLKFITSNTNSLKHVWIGVTKNPPSSGVVGSYYGNVSAVLISNPYSTTDLASNSTLRTKLNEGYKYLIIAPEFSTNSDMVARFEIARQAKKLR